MKKILLIALLIIPMFAISQTTVPIDGFLGIKFGSTKLAVIAALKAKGAIVVKEDPATGSVAFGKIKLGSRAADILLVRFVNNKAYLAVFTFTPTDKPQTLEYYNSLVSDINDKYGPGKATVDFKSPFKLGDGHEITAIQGGYVNMFTDWQSGDHSVEVTINHDDDDINVDVIYCDDTLQAIVDAKSKAKEKADF